MALSPFGSRPELVFVPTRNNIDIVDVMSGEHCGTLRGHYSQVNCCEFNENTLTLFSAGSDRNILMWTCVPSTYDIYNKYIQGENRVESGEREPPVMYVDEWTDED